MIFMQYGGQYCCLEKVLGLIPGFLTGGFLYIRVSGDAKPPLGVSVFVCLGVDL